uniref:Transglycosylase SLT domain-containing protein n=1 Tax=uncultured bacterium contig00010 TaxID=1181502 RepID=A0A806KEZ1_9BACT|nr:hypothetical protein [uncultured bacterium contig00010]
MFVIFSLVGVIVLCFSIAFQEVEPEEEFEYESRIVSVATEHLSELTEDFPELTSQLPVHVAAVDAAALSQTLDFLTHKEPVHVDHILELYRQADTRNCVIAFFTGVCGSENIAKIILASADQFGVSPALAFALSWQESRFDPQAINRANSNGTVDRGLFQLNSRSFPELRAADFFNPEINTFNAMKHLSACLKTGESEIGALAIYNAGIGRVNRSGAPWVTLDYISQIEENRDRIKSHFAEWESCFLAKPVDPEIVTIEIIREEHSHHHLSLPKLTIRH